MLSSVQFSVLGPPNHSYWTRLAGWCTQDQEPRLDTHSGVLYSALNQTSRLDDAGDPMVFELVLDDERGHTEESGKVVHVVRCDPWPGNPLANGSCRCKKLGGKRATALLPVGLRAGHQPWTSALIMQ